MKCYLHIGTEKTATTTLQTFLDLNKDKFNKYGYAYTKNAGQINNYKLAMAAYSIDKRDDLTNLNILYSDSDLLEFQKKIIYKLKKEITSIAQPNIIFSSEHIQSRLTKLSDLERLKAILLNLGIDDVSVIVYLRNPVEIASSLYSTAIINGHTFNEPPAPTNNYFNNICNHKSTLEKFGLVFGKQAIIPRIFDKNEFINGSILKDFTELIGIPWDDDYQIPDNQNESLSTLGLEVLRRFNQKVPLFVNKKINPVRNNIVKYFHDYFNDNKYQMPKHLHNKYENEFKESNEWVRENWFPTRPYLFRKKNYTNETMTKTSDIELNQFANMLANIWIDKH